LAPRDNAFRAKKDDWPALPSALLSKDNEMSPNAFSVRKEKWDSIPPNGSQ
jgi:hypothetical protein